MADKQLKNKAIKIKGKDYIMVKDRLIYFNETYPYGSITTELITEPKSELIIFKARVLPESGKDQIFTGYSQAIVGGAGVNATAALENCETSAVGRALAMMGIGVLDSVASADEINKSNSNKMRYATEPQLKWIRDTVRKLDDTLGDDDEVDVYIESILTIPPRMIPIYKVEDAINKLKEVHKEAQAKLVDSDIDLDQEKIPY